jgi:hypothetical protein
MGWLVVFLALAVAAAFGALAWAFRERRLRTDAERRLLLALEHLAATVRSLEQRDAELSSVRCALILAQQEAREAGERERIARLSDQAVAEGLAAALAARRAGRRPAGGSADPAALATCDTAPDLHGLAAPTSALPAGTGLLPGAGGPGGARGLGPR